MLESAYSGLSPARLRKDIDDLIQDLDRLPEK